MKAYLVVVSVVSAMVAGCGGDETCADCALGGDVAEVVTASALPGGESAESGGFLTRTLALEMWNASDYSRICQYSYSYPELDGTTVSGNVVASETLDANEWRRRSVTVPLGRVVTLTANCRHSGWPEVDIRAGETITTLPMTVNRACTAIYDEAYGPDMVVPCA